MKTIIFVTLLVAFGHLRPVHGSCLSYGHSCWGAHGKRSGVTTNTQLVRPNLKQLSLAQRFALFKLNRPTDEGLKNDEVDPIRITSSQENDQLDNIAVPRDDQASSANTANDLDFLETPKIVHDFNPKYTAGDKTEDNAMEFLNAVESLPNIEDIVFANSKDDNEWQKSQHIRRLKPGPRRFYAQSRN